MEGANHIHASQFSRTEPSLDLSFVLCIHSCRLQSQGCRPRRWPTGEWTKLGLLNAWQLTRRSLSSGREGAY